MNPMPTLSTLIEVGGVVDASGVQSSPGALLLAPDPPPDPLKAPGVVVLAAGHPRDVSTHPAAASALLVRLPGHVLIPGLANAHTHLDLTHVGPQPHDPRAGFAAWADMIITARRTDPAAIAASVREGVRLSLAGAVVAVGDIAGIAMSAPVDELRLSPLIGASFVEFFGVGKGQEAAAARMRAIMQSIEPFAAGVRAGVQPHAPYSAGLRFYAAAVDLHRQTGAPLATHLAEMLEEREFIASGAGPMRSLLERIGVWDDTTFDELRRAAHPVAHLAESLRAAPFLLAHVNDAGDREIELLAETGASVAYCPRGHEYFGHPETLGPHPYQRMLRAGVNVALGTDSVVNLWKQGGEALTRCSTLDEMRLLHARDGVDARILLAMATTRAAAALGLPPEWFEFSPGPIAGVAAIDVSHTSPTLPPAARVLSSSAAPRLLARDGSEFRVA